MTQINPAIGMSHVDLAELAAEESMVLLKNENNTLPIKPREGPKHRGHRRQREVRRFRTRRRISSGCSIDCTLDFTTNVRTGDLGSSRVFSDPAKAKGPFDGHQGGGRQRRSP